MKVTDTIAAIASAASNAGIGIIRLSGKESMEIVNKIFIPINKNKEFMKVKSHTVHFGHIVDNEEMVDEVIVIVMRSPNSYTTEDVVEIDCHGGSLVMQKILSLVIKNGARIAEPGEFTKRAFLNGRIDLSQAESVMDIINSQSDMALKSSLNQLKGSVRKAIKDLREKIIYHIAFIESALDDPEHISLDGYPEELMAKTEDILSELQTLADSADNGKMLKEGINTVIIGKPNAGKSSLLNLLVGEEKAIVTNIAGTTRDILEETIKLHGIGLNIVDTAGIRATEDVVEKIGVEKAKKYADEADLILYVVDSSVPLDDSDDEIIQMISDKKCIILLNKSDLEGVVTEELLKEKLQQKLGDISGEILLSNFVIIKTSTKENTGIDEFEQILKDMFFHGEIKMNDEIYITNVRHKSSIADALESMKMVKQSILDDMPEDFYSIDLMSAYTSLGTIIGEEVGEDLVNEIFSKFCMGK